MGLIASYNLRSLLVRKTTALMTAMGVAMVVAVFVMTLAIAQGFRATLVRSGSPQNAIVLRKGATAETVSYVPRTLIPMIETLPQVKRSDGQPLASPELVVIVSLPRIRDAQPANVPARGVGPRAFAVRPSLTFVEGRAFRPGFREINVGRLAANRFRGLTMGSQVKMGGGTWTVVGIFSDNDASFEGEVWGDVDQMASAFQRPLGYQSVTVRLIDESAFDSFASALAADPRLNMRPQRELEYYAEQSRAVTTVITALGSFVTLILSIGAMFGAMNTMYAAVANRTREIGTLRALGFSRVKIVTAFLVESIALGLAGGAVGCLLALPIHGMSSGTMNFSSFSEIAFKFRITPTLLAGGLLFAGVMGACGGLLPALRAARIPVARALREV